MSKAISTPKAPRAKLRLEEITLSPTRRLLKNFSGNILLFGDFSTIGYRKKEPLCIEEIITALK